MRTTRIGFGVVVALGGGATGGARVRVARARGRLASLRGSRRPSRWDRTDRHPSHASVWRAILFWIRAQS